MSQSRNNKRQSHRNVKAFLKKLIPTLKIHSVTRISLDLELRRQFKRLKPGIVLDVGSSYSPYKKYISHTKYLTLDIDEETKPDICCDLHKIEWQSNYFDTVIATEVLEHLYEPSRAINEIYRILKPGGICILSTRFIFHYHAIKTPDYYRFTWDSLNYLFGKFSKVEIYHHGNKIQALWQILNSGILIIVLNIFNPIIARIRFKKTICPCGFVVYAVK